MSAFNDVRPSKRFGISSPRELLSKLLWEIENLADPTTGITVQGYNCFNAAVTAWHLTDWVWKAYHSEECTLREFQQHIRQKSIELAVCDQLANGSKHFEKDHHNREDVYSTIEDSVIVYRSETGKHKFVQEPSIFVYAEGYAWGPFALFDDVYKFWSEYVSTREAGQHL